MSVVKNINNPGNNDDSTGNNDENNNYHNQNENIININNNLTVQLSESGKNFINEETNDGRK